MVLMVSSCSQVNTFQTSAQPLTETFLQTVSTYPVHGTDGVSSKVGIGVVFDLETDTSTVDQAFNMFEGDYDVAANPKSFSTLTLETPCNGLWKVTNPNSETISFDWRSVKKPSDGGSGVVLGKSNALFYTYPGNEITLSVSGIDQATLSSSASVCPAKVWKSLWSADGKTVKFTPTTPLKEKTNYTFIIDTSAMSSKTAGDKRLEKPFMLKFQTGYSGISKATGNLDSRGGTFALMDKAFLALPKEAIDSSQKIQIDQFL